MQALVALIVALLGGPPKGVLYDLPPMLTERAHTLAAPNRVVVKFRQTGAGMGYGVWGMAPRAADSSATDAKPQTLDPRPRLVAAAMGYPVLREIPGIGYTVLLCPFGKVDESIAKLKASGLVDEAQADHVYFPAYVPNDPLFSSQWNLFDQNIPQVWDTVKGDSKVIIAVTDTGVDYNHADLAPNIWHNVNDLVNGIDDDHNGYVDDYLGWNFAYNNRDPMDDYGHGTCCASINAAVQDNSMGISGIAPHCQIMCVKIGLSSGYSYDSMFAPGVIYAADNGAKVISCSFFSDDLTPALRAASDYAYNKGVLLSVAAGNFDEIFPVYPAGYDTAIAVAAHDPSDNKASFSNFGTWVDVSAPGVGVPVDTMGGGSTTGFSGTSAAAPNAAGVLALLRSRYPNETNEQIRRRLEYSARPIRPMTEGEVCNYGRVDALAALHWPSPAHASSVTAQPAWPEVRWISPMQLPAEGGTVEIAGRRFKPGMGTTTVTLGSTTLTPTRITDGRIDVTVPPGLASGTLSVTSPLGKSVVPLAIGAPGDVKVAAPSDYSFVTVGWGSQPPSGKPSDLWYADGKTVHVPVDSNGNCEIRVLVRNLDKAKISYLKVGMTRDYGNAASGSWGTISLYNFASASYPYGSWETALSESPSPGAGTVTQEETGDVSRFVSYEGDLFVVLQCSLGSADAYVDIDRLWFEWK